MVEYVSTVYAKSLFEVSIAEKCEAEVLDNVKALKTVFAENANFLAVLKSPVIELSEKISLIDEIFSNANIYVKNFIKLLVEKNRIAQIFSIISAFEEQYNNYYNITEVVVKTACELGDELKQKLKAKLETQLSKTVTLNCKIEPSILGGIVLEYDGKQVDASVSTKLLNLKSEISKVIL
ncbi:MAG: ATP synthase F1 subunit delta [Oscillospiraceae bacterium]|nr:ATP synthase F1 subunit delta [Oscillospiraceae bacterium]